MFNYNWKMVLDHDLTKILKHFKNLDIKAIDILDNSHKCHAELNILSNYEEADYIGVSKLSCFVCDGILREVESNKSKIIHTGTSGIVYSIDSVPDKFLLMQFVLGIIRLSQEIKFDGTHDATEIDTSVQYIDRPFSPIDEALIKLSGDSSEQ